MVGLLVVSCGRGNELCLGSFELDLELRRDIFGAGDGDFRCLDNDRPWGLLDGRKLLFFGPVMSFVRALIFRVSTFFARRMSIDFARGRCFIFGFGADLGVLAFFLPMVRFEEELLGE